MQSHREKKIKIRIFSILKWFFSINGVIITFMLSIITALFAFVIQDAIQRQRYLELLELELRANVIKTNTDITTFNTYGAILNPQPFSTSVFQSGLQSGYLLTIDPKVLGPLYLIYTSYIPGENQIILHNQVIMDSYHTKWETCLLDLSGKKIGSNPCANEKIVQDNVNKVYSRFIVQAELNVAKQIGTIQFNPTNDRMSSPLLKLFMGKDSLKVQQ